MTRPTDTNEIEQMLRQIENLEDPPEHQLDAFAAQLDASPQWTASLAGRRPPVSPELAVATPDAPAWEATWERIASASTRGGRRLRMGVWQPLTAAACVAVLSLALRFTSGPLASAGPAEGWELSLATGVTVDELEVFGNTTTFVAYEGDFDDLSSTAMIWVLDAADDKGV